MNDQLSQDVADIKEAVIGLTRVIGPIDSRTQAMQRQLGDLPSREDYHKLLNAVVDLAAKYDEHETVHGVDDNQVRRMQRHYR